MLRITKRVFSDLAIYMTGFGILIGIGFPFFLQLLGVPASLVMTGWFFAVCIAAGLIVGAVNILLARSVVGSRLKELVKRMRYISGHLEKDDHKDIVKNCRPDECLLKVDSEDLLGESASSYNVLVQSLFDSIKSELMVREFTSMLSLRLELEDLAQSVLPALLSDTGTEAGAVIMEREGDYIVAASHRINGPEKLCEGDIIAQTMKLKKRSLITLPKDIVVQGSVLDFTPAEVCVDPLLYHDVPLGVIILAGSKPMAEAALTFLDLVNASLAVAFRNALTYDQLQRLAANDSLTGMFNRRFGMARLQEEYGRALRSGSPIGVCLFDLDHFKLVNDTYGHPFGDKVLIHVSKLIRSALREGDVALRYGGEEFLVVLPGASLTDAFDIGERIRRLVESSQFQHGSQTLTLTISGGTASWPDFDASSSEALVRRADEALYRAKEEGRNRILAV
ncbi:MAG: GGDEF domain-containing protein [Spirochaetia bacterium]|jgi:diguanylate cyclase (GGDEF)-like protein|nr:GGDEF domain-containing protein [Spirochaetales bacterium]MDX9784086.1 GGDEF domain-containing protein [Spirochaetia bacterium]